MSTAFTLEDAKARLNSAGLLGKFGIHGFGLSRARQAVRIYVDTNASPPPSTMREIRQLVAPYQVDVVEEEQARVS